MYAGQNDISDDQLVHKYEGSLVQNCIIRNIGSVSGRPGLTLVGTDYGDQNILGFGPKRIGTKFLTHVVNGASVSQVELFTSGDWSPVSGAELTKDRHVFTIESDNGNVYYFDGDGSHNVGKFDGTNWALVGGMPKGRYPALWKNFLWIGGVEAYPRRLYLSNIGDHETFDASDYIDFPYDIVGVRGYFNLLVVATTHEVFFIDGSSQTDFVVSGQTVYVPSGFDFGIASHESMQIVGNELWGMDREGRIRRIFRSPNDAIFGGIISDKIEALTQTFNKNQLSKVTAAFINGYYIFFAPVGSDTENSIGAYYDTRLPLPSGIPSTISRWSVLKGWTPSHLAVYESSQTPELYVGESGAHSRIYKWAGTDDNGEEIEMIWRGARTNNGFPNNPKQYRWGKQMAQPIGNYTGLIKADIDSTGMYTIKTMNFAGNNKLLGDDWTLGEDELGDQGKLDTNFFFNEGGADINGKTLQMELYALYAAAIPSWGKQTYLYKVLKMR
jgi:hypothetical protein